MDPKSRVKDIVDKISPDLLYLSRRVHALAETAFEEVESVAEITKTLENFGLHVEPVQGMPTAFIARAGSGSLNVGICLEYDALPESGHACGHNTIAAAGAGAAIALAAVADELDITVTALGTPAEENGGGKISMLRKGSFDGLHASLMVHAAAIERDAMKTLAVAQWHVRFTGRPAHAAAAPERGKSASAAMALAQSGLAFAREHFHEGDRLHGIVTRGGDAPNIVPGLTEGVWYVRSLTAERLVDLQHAVADVFKGAAMMTGCSLEIRRTSANYVEVITDDDMARFWRANAALVGRESLPIQPSDGPASTDMGNVSYAMPSIHPMIAIESNGHNIHEAEFAQAAASESADRAVVDGAITLARTVVDMASDDAVRSRLLSRSFQSAAVINDPTTLYLGSDSEEPVRFP